MIARGITIEEMSIYKRDVGVSIMSEANKHSEHAEETP
jgi:hypothetical protein